MQRARLVIGTFVLAGIVAGCGGGEITPDKLPPEQKAPDYGQKSADQMKNEIGAPGAGGVMKK